MPQTMMSVFGDDGKINQQQLTGPRDGEGMASSGSSGGLDWILGTVSSLEGLSNT